MFAQLGSIPFQGLKGFTQFNEGRSTNLAEHPRIDGKPRLQRVGSNLHELSVSIMLHASFCNPEQDFALLDDARENAEILPLVLANGVYVSDYVIEAIERNIQQTDARSNIVSMLVSMTLKEAYNPDPMKSLSISAKQNAYATSDGGAKALRIVRPMPPTIAQASINDIAASKLQAGVIDSQIQRAEIVTAERPYLSDRILKGLSSIEQASQRVQANIIEPALNPFARSLPTSINSVISSLNNMRAALPISNIQDVKLLNVSLQNSINNMVTSGGLLKNAVITRKL